jgi:DNA-binding transcriptional LysR family regulator
MDPSNCADKPIKADHADLEGRAMPSVRLDHLETFALIARCGGFRAAAAERGVSSSVMSQTLGALETTLGIRLLNRTTRSVAVTEAGERLLSRLAPALDDIHLALAEIDQLREQPSGTLRINAPAPAVDHVLCPLAFAFMQAHPDVTIEIVSDAAIVDIVDQGFDAGVRFGQQLAQDMIALPLGKPLRYAIVASPAYLALHGRPQTPSELAAHNCIRRRYPGGTWATWSFIRNGETIEIAPEGRLGLSSAQQELQAAIAGQGIAHVFEDYARPALTDGTLIELLTDWSPTLPSWYLYYPSRRHHSAAMRAFLDFVRQSSRLPDPAEPAATGFVPHQPQASLRASTR